MSQTLECNVWTITIITKHSTFYTSAELDTLKRLKQVLTSYNNLTIEERGQLAININGMMINPFSYLLR